MEQKIEYKKQNNKHRKRESRYLKNKSVNSREFINTLFIFFLMFFSNDTYLFGSNQNALFVSFPRYLTLIFCVFGVFWLINNGLFYGHKGEIIWYVIMLVTFSIISWLNREYVNRTVNKILFMTGGLLVCVILNFHDFSVAFRNSLLFIAAASNLLWFFAYLAPDLVLHLPQIENTAGIRFATIIISGLDLTTIHTSTIRMGGIYWEPGVYEMFLNIAILFELFMEEKPRIGRLFIYCIALFSTFSTTGYIAFLWILLMLILFGGKNAKAFKASRWFVVLPFIAIILFFAVTGTTVGQQVFGKAINLHEGTTMVRFASVFASINIVLAHPLLGVGMEHISDQMRNLTLSSNVYYGWTTQNTNTFLYQFAAHGCIFGSLFLIGSLLFGKVFNKGKIFTFCIFILFFIFYIGENYMVSIVPYLFIFYGFESTKKENVQIRGEVTSNAYPSYRYIIY